MTRNVLARTAVVAAVTIAAAAGLGTAARTQALDACGPSDTKPLWIDYGEGAVPKEVRDVFARPGVVLAASGTALPKTYRDKGAGTVFFVLNLPRLVGDPAEPADPASIDAAVQQTYDRAVASTECSTPIIALNELLGPAAPLPWSPSVARYRANVLALLRGLAAKGARPTLFVHGNPIFTGEAAARWKSVGTVAGVAYEAYYNAPVIVRLGRIVGTRRMRLGMRSITKRLIDAGIPRERVGLVLGFQVALGAAGREGLQPSSDWYRFVKWNALAAHQCGPSGCRARRSSIVPCRPGPRPSTSSVRSTPPVTRAHRLPSARHPRALVQSIGDVGRPGTIVPSPGLRHGARRGVPALRHADGMEARNDAVPPVSLQDRLLRGQHRRMRASGAVASAG